MQCARCNSYVMYLFFPQVLSSCQSFCVMSLLGWKLLTFHLQTKEQGGDVHNVQHGPRLACPHLHLGQHDITNESQSDGLHGQVQALTFIWVNMTSQMKVKVMVYMVKCMPSPSLGSTWHHKRRSRRWSTWPNACPHLHLSQHDITYEGQGDGLHG